VDKSQRRFAQVIAYCTLTLPVFYSGCADSNPSKHGKNISEEKPFEHFGNIPDKDWKTIRIGQAFSFRAPPQLNEKPTQGKDSLAGMYSSPDLDLTFDLGWYSDPLSHENLANFTTKQVTIDGIRARIVTFGKNVGIHFPRIDETSNPPTKLTMTITQKSSAAREVALKIFNSIRFQHNENREGGP